MDCLKNFKRHLLSFKILDNFLISQKKKIIHQVWSGTIPNKKKAKKTYDKFLRYRNIFTTGIIIATNESKIKLTISLILYLLISVRNE